MLELCMHNEQKTLEDLEDCNISFSLSAMQEQPLHLELASNIFALLPGQAVDNTTVHPPPVATSLYKALCNGLGHVRHTPLVLLHHLVTARVPGFNLLIHGAPGRWGIVGRSQLVI
jgi:hypothetical protein